MQELDEVDTDIIVEFLEDLATQRVDISTR
jgi:hypothetical protein